MKTLLSPVNMPFRLTNTFLRAVKSISCAVKPLHGVVNGIFAVVNTICWAYIYIFDLTNTLFLAVKSILYVVNTFLCGVKSIFDFANSTVQQDIAIFTLSKSFRKQPAIISLPPLCGIEPVLLLLIPADGCNRESSLDPKIPR